MQAEATINLPESVTSSVEEATEGRMLMFDVRNSKLAPHQPVNSATVMMGEDCIVGDSMYSRL